MKIEISEESNCRGGRRIFEVLLDGKLIGKIEQSSAECGIDRLLYSLDYFYGERPYSVLKYCLAVRETAEPTLNEISVFDDDTNTFENFLCNLGDLRELIGAYTIKFVDHYLEKNL